MSKDKKQFSKTFNIKVIGIGGAGNNIVKYMKTSQEWPDFVQIIALNTDYVALSAMGDLTDIFILGAKELDGNGSVVILKLGKWQLQQILK
ncbi:cell division protein FtsZ [Mycoplasmopsis fermentans]|nr:cell division protein FtsZ [Mycoplasmopsis fermentans]